ncbi:MAG: response regulator transcription factor, partial [Gemmatimonadaceae bacterium]
DYVTKPFGLMELLARIDALLRRSQRSLAAPAPDASGGASPRDSALAFADVRIDTSTRTVTRGGAEVALRPREFDLLAALVRRDGQVASRLDLLREVWGYDDSVMSRTVDTHIAEVRRKLERDPAHPAHILTVLKTGYRIKR